MERKQNVVTAFTEFKISIVVPTTDDSAAEITFLNAFIMELCI